jgi:dolichol-phosphate mannosyltransferase
VTLTIVIPTRNEGENVSELVRRIGDALVDVDAEVVFVDDSTDDTADVIRSSARSASLLVQVIHRADPVGGLSGAVVEGLRASREPWCLIMDGDLQHPPELIPSLLATALDSGVDVVVATRYRGLGAADGLHGILRKSVSLLATALTRSMFPLRLRDCSDPMTGFFLVRREALDLNKLRPRGFKILLEILVRQRLSIAEEPFTFGDRGGGASKASASQGAMFLAQLASLRFGRLSAFATIGGLGAMANLAVMALLIEVGTGYLWAASVAAVMTIIGNFALQERFVFADLREEGRSLWRRLVFSVGFNTVEAAARLPVLWLLVHLLAVPSILAQAATLVVAFLARFIFHARVVYRPRRAASRTGLHRLTVLSRGQQ